MRNPEAILYTLSSKEESYVHNDLYRILYNKEFYFRAYGKIYAKEGNMTPGADGKTIDGFKVEKIDELIVKLKNQTFSPNPSRRTYIAKKNSTKKRPLGIPSFEDKLLQTVVEEILSAIFERHFKNSSHGFRPKRSCHTALQQIKVSNNGTRWWVEGDIEGFFDNIDHHVLMGIVSKRINDHRFISLLWKFLKAGYLENWTFHNTYSGTPQGGIISPILANIYLNELDKYMEEVIKKFNKGKERQRSKQYKAIDNKIYKMRNIAKLSWESQTDEEKKAFLKKLKEVRLQQYKGPTLDPMDESFRRMTYTRYADDFLIGISGSKEDAEQVKVELTKFLKESLKLNLSQEKTLVTHGADKVLFLGYHIYMCKKDEGEKVLQNGKHQRMRSKLNKPFLSIPHEKMRDFLLKKQALVIEQEGTWKSTHRKPLLPIGDYEILCVYNSEIRGLYNYYKLAVDVKKLNGLYHIMRYSFLKTLANKHKTKVAKIMKNKKDYVHDGQLGVVYKTAKGEKFGLFYNEGFQYRSLNFSYGKNETDADVDNKPAIESFYRSRTSIVQRLLANTCEWCGETMGKMEVHHVRKLKDLKGKKKWEQVMISRQRKTLVLCSKPGSAGCHEKLHLGLLS
ncbi:reverse transcriptase domain-containing protein [Brevibacillus reuszeri]|uniref:reverse transcriptase domain-containing protein n=1 Tax=Brevibacillus reuszeri TaxID=54915 RepID=UPI000CCBDEB3|nr:reverse transcriptase domain-containing protein [Brevibacillus reuszeri]